MVNPVAIDQDRASDWRQVARSDQIRRLEAELVELMARLPRHSVPATMLLEIEEMEEQLALLRAGTAPVGS